MAKIILVQFSNAKLPRGVHNQTISLTTQNIKHSHTITCTLLSEKCHINIHVKVAQIKVNTGGELWICYYRHWSDGRLLITERSPKWSYEVVCRAKRNFKSSTSKSQDLHQAKLMKLCFGVNEWNTITYLLDMYTLLSVPRQQVAAEQHYEKVSGYFWRLVGGNMYTWSTVSFLILTMQHSHHVTKDWIIV